MDELKSRLSALEGRLNTMTQEEKWRVDIALGQAQIRDEVKQLRVAILGDGVGVTGMNTRLDRVEQVQEGRKWQMRAVVAGFMAVLCKTLWDIFLAAAGQHPPKP